MWWCQSRSWDTGLPCDDVKWIYIWITEDSQATLPSFGKWHETENFCLIFFSFHQHITSHTHIYICTSFSKTLTVACVHAWVHACLYLSVCVCVYADTYKQVSFHSWKSWHTKRYYILNVKHIFFFPLHILWTYCLLPNNKAGLSPLHPNFATSQWYTQY